MAGGPASGQDAGAPILGRPADGRAAWINREPPPGRFRAADQQPRVAQQVRKHGQPANGRVYGGRAGDQPSRWS
jgi:hypothetical protein